MPIDRSDRPPHKRKREPGKRWQRRMQALDMRKLGLNYVEIARKLGYSSPDAARGSVNSALRSVEVEKVNDLRRIHMSRLEAMLQRAWPEILASNLKAIHAALAILEREARLMGLDIAPDVAVLQQVMPTINIFTAVPRPPQIAAPSVVEAEREIIDGYISEPEISAPAEADTGP